MSRSARRLTEGPVGGHLFALGGPMVFGILAVLSVSLVDTYFVSKLGTQPLAALSFTFPVTLTLTSLGIGLGAGAASVISRAIGGGERDEARRLTTDSLILALLIILVVAAIGWLTIDPLFGLIGAEGETLDLVRRYMRIWYLSLPFLVVPMVANAIIRAIGDALWPSLIMVGAAVVNIALTPVFIFGFGPVPAFDIEGAAISTLIARMLTLVAALPIVVFRERLVAFALPALSELVSSWRRVLSVAVPAAMGNMISPVGIGVVTGLLAAYGDATVAAFGAATRIESFASVPLLAMSAAIAPVAGQNWGGGEAGRIRRALILSYRTSLAWSGVLAALFWIAAEPIAGFFASEPEVREIASQYLRIVSLSLWGYGMVIVSAGAFNAIGKSLRGFGFYAVRIALLYVPGAWLAVQVFDREGAFVAIAIANAASGAAAAAYALWWLGRRDR
jgi:putative MATE family efflux protein